MNSNTYTGLPTVLKDLPEITLDERVADRMVEMREDGRAVETIPVEQFIARKRAERKQERQNRRQGRLQARKRG